MMAGRDLGFTRRAKSRQPCWKSFLPSHEHLNPVTETKVKRWNLVESKIFKFCSVILLFGKKIKSFDK